MSDECVIEFRQNGAQLDLDVRAPNLGAGKTYARQALTLAPDELRQLRAGTLSDTMVNDLAARISAWLQTPDFDLPLVLGLQTPATDLWRLVFSVGKIKDEKVRAELSDIPIELMTQQGDQTPFVLHNRIASLVHLLPKVGSPPTTATAGTWPLRILLVRSSPSDLPPVPEAAPIRDAILALRPDLAGANGGPRLVQVEILSSEPGAGVAGPPTKQQLKRQLGLRYDILVYLGHGDVREAQAGALPISQLQLETDDRFADPLDQRRLSNLLHENPVPVVLLVGCLTAADLDPEAREEVQDDIPNWFRGNQGVAQALINGQSGVQFAVGMRSMIAGKDAKVFLEAFFESLLRQAPDLALGGVAGDVELAVRRARHELDLLGNLPLSWAAPVVFRTLGSEPTFPFLAAPPVYNVDPKVQKARAEIWDTLAMLNWSLRPPASTTGLYDRVCGLLKGFEDEMLEAALGHAAILLPERREIAPAELAPDLEETPVNVPIVLHGAVTLRTLRGTMVEGTGTGRIGALELNPALEAAGWELPVWTAQNNQLKFTLQRADGMPGMLPAGPLFTARLLIGPAVQVVYTVNIDDLQSDPQLALCASDNAVIVPPA